MSVVSKNPFELLGDDGEERAPAPAPKAAAAPAPASQQPKVVPGAAPKGGRGARYPPRGGPRNVYHEERPVTEGDEGFDGERVAPPKRQHQGRDAHTKGPREDRSHTGPRSRAPGAAGARGPKGQGQGRGPRGGAAAAGAEQPKKTAPTETWGNEEGKAELSAENQGETDAVEAAATPAEEAVQEEAEPEDNSKTLDQYLAEKAEKALGGVLAQKEARQVSAEDVEGKTFKREELDNFFSGKATKANAPKEKAHTKKEKVYIEVDGQFATPAGRPPRTEGGGRGGARGGRGGPRGGARGSGAPRGGAARGGARPARQTAVEVNDEKAFPALGA